MTANYTKREAITRLQAQVAALEALVTASYIKVTDSSDGNTYKIKVNNGIVITEEV